MNNLTVSKSQEASLAIECYPNAHRKFLLHMSSVKKEFTTRNKSGPKPNSWQSTCQEFSENEQLATGEPSKYFSKSFQI